jgi:hypothetical protein
MNMWLREKFEYYDRTALRYSKENVSKLVTINAKLQLIDPSREWDTEDSDESYVEA